MKILALYNQTSAVGYYRSQIPVRVLRELGHEVTAPNRPLFSMKPQAIKGSSEKAHLYWLSEQVGKYDLIFVERCLDSETVATLAGLRHYSPDCRMLVDIDDDFLHIPKWNPAYSKYTPGTEARESILNHLAISEGTTVSTLALGRTLAGKAHEIFHAPNFIDPADWEGFPLNPERRGDPHLRILYGGAQGHFGDLDIISGQLEKLLRNPPVPIRLVCFGAAPTWMHDLKREIPGRVLVNPWIPFEDYPAAVAWGGFDLAIAPLADHPFNLCKTAIKGYEAAIQKIPFVCSNYGPYREIPDGAALRLDPGDWLDGLIAALESEDLRDKIRTNAYQWVNDTATLPHASKVWYNILEKVPSLPRIEALEDTRVGDGSASLPTEDSESSISIEDPV